MGKELSQNQKIGIAAVTLAILALAGTGIYFLANSGLSSPEKENQQQDLTTPQNGGKGKSEQHSEESAGNGGSSPAKSPKPKSPVTKENAEEKFSKAMKALEEDPKTPTAPALVEDAAAAFKDAKAKKSKGSPLYHPALEFETLEEFLKESTKPEKKGPNVEKLKEVQRLLSEHTFELHRKKEEPERETEDAMEKNKQKGNGEQPVKEKKTFEEMKDTFKTEYLDIASVSSLNNKSFDALINKAKAEENEPINSKEGYVFYNNLRLLKTLDETIKKYPTDALMEKWANEEFIIRGSTTFPEILKNHSKYPNLADILGFIHDRMIHLKLGKKTELQPNLEKNFKSRDYRMLDIALPQIVCDEFLSDFLGTAWNDVKSKPENFPRIIDFCTAEDDVKMEAAVTELLKNVSLKDSVMDALSGMKLISPYRAVYEKLRKSS